MSEEQHQAGESPRDATRLRRFPSRTEAALAQSRLAAEGIDSWLAGGFSPYETAVDGAEILVRTPDLEAAQEVLESIKLGLEDQVRRGDRPCCMDCGGTDLEFPKPPPPAGLRRVIWNFIHGNRAEIRCRDCGYTWLVRL